MSRDRDMRSVEAVCAALDIDKRTLMRRARKDELPCEDALTTERVADADYERMCAAGICPEYLILFCTKIVPSVPHGNVRNLAARRQHSCVVDINHHRRRKPRSHTEE